MKENVADKAAYDGISGWYDESLRDGPIGLFHELAIPAVLKLAGDVKGRKVCDLACGQGIVARRLAALKADVVGIDISEKLLDIARRYERSGPGGVSYVHDDAQKLDTVADGTFGGVVCNLALMDIPCPASVFRAVHRISRPGGWFVFSIIHPCFLTPGSPRWVREGERIVGMEVRDYFEEGHWRKDTPEGVRGRVGSHHRTLSSYLNALSNAGLALEQCEEPRATEEIANHLPGYKEVPGILIVRCKKPKDDAP